MKEHSRDKRERMWCAGNVKTAIFAVTKKAYVMAYLMYSS